MKHAIVGITLAAVALASGATVSAQPLGTYRWQLAPHCNVVTLNVTSQGAVFTLDGFDDQCGAGQRASVIGTAFLNPDGTVGIGLNTVLSPGGAFVHVEARISLASLSGPWRDSAGNSGTFAFTPRTSAGGPQRPVAGNGIAASSITAAQLAPGAVAAHINPAQVQARVSGTCAAGHYLRGINQDGSVQCQPVPVAVGASASGSLVQGTFPSDLSILVSLSRDGGSSLVVPFRARLFAHGIVHIDRVAPYVAATCQLAFVGTELFNFRRIDVYLGTGTSSPSLQHSIEVEPGTYDVQLRCRSPDNGWHDPQLTVLAVPR